MTAGDGIQVLGQGVGYGIVVGIGAFFAGLMYDAFHFSILRQLMSV